MPDPQEAATFERSKLSRQRDPELEGFYAELLRLRRELPAEVAVKAGGSVIRLRRGALEVVADLDAKTAELRR